jgi:8-oxo-dGTP diphosphatase
VTRQVVVGAAITDGTRVLAARRRSPAHLAGHWEFPGGKVEAGESEYAALVRECDEELGVIVAPGPLLGRAPIDDTRELAVYLARLVRGTPSAGADHDGVRWLPADALDDLPWLDADRPFLKAVCSHLSPGRRFPDQAPK